MTVIVAIILGVLVFKVTVFIAFVSNFKAIQPISNDAELPTVSVLIPARNEETHLPACLEALLSMDYPEVRLEILVGNDQSQDSTGHIATQYAGQYEHVKCIDIVPDYKGLVARSNVLAQLAGESSNELLVFLDADMQVSEQWLRQMVGPAVQGFDLVSGYTEVRADNWLSRFQKMDWLNVIILLKAAADLERPGTALGNNMLVNKKAYDAAGGYEQIGPTYTEDNDLTLKLTSMGSRLSQVASQHCALTEPMDNFKDLYQQRSRWMQGAFRQPLYRLLPVVMSRLFVLWVILLIPWSPSVALQALLAVSFGEMILSAFMALRTHTRFNVLTALTAPVFNSVLDTFTLLTFPWNKKVIWKGRKLK